MYLLYVDESGDIGLDNSPSKYFILSGFVVHEFKWHDTLNSLIEFRQNLKSKYGLKLKEEIHTSDFMYKPGTLKRIPKHKRLQILKDVLRFEATLQDVNIINVVVNKVDKDREFNVFEQAWTILIQRFHNTIFHKNFPGSQNFDDYGLLVVDQTDEKKLRNLLRKMRRYNPVPNRGRSGFRNIVLTTIIEDPIHRNSLHSYFIQVSDVNSYFLLQKIEPSGYIKRKGARNLFNCLDPILCKVASTKDSQGIVFI